LTLLVKDEFGFDNKYLKFLLSPILGHCFMVRATQRLHPLDPNNPLHSTHHPHGVSQNTPLNPLNDSVVDLTHSKSSLSNGNTRLALLAGVVRSFSEQDNVYGELALINCADPDLLPHLDWQSQETVKLLRNVQRLTAPNPGLMTGPGTNTYIVGDSIAGYIVIDPGPLNDDHIQRIAQVCAGQIKMIVCTHSHADHSPAAKPLQILCQQSYGFAPPILGLASKSTARANSEFTPDQELTENERLTLGEHTLRVIFTPGHAANHLCLVLEEDGLLFSGDHVLNGSTTIVDPPDGHMGQYLHSLEVLKGLCDQYRIGYIFPAHGYVLGNEWGRAGAATEVIEHLYQHRLKREAKIYACVTSHPNGTIDDWVRVAYDDVQPSVWPIAKRSLTAHLEHLRETGKLTEITY
jgi:recombination protein RecT